jgi:hypothetical protein
MRSESTKRAIARAKQRALREAKARRSGATKSRSTKARSTKRSSDNAAKREFLKQLAEHRRRNHKNRMAEARSQKRSSVRRNVSKEDLLKQMKEARRAAAGKSSRRSRVTPSRKTAIRARNLEERVERLKRKLEKRKRIEKARKRMIERRLKAGDKYGAVKLAKIFKEQDQTLGMEQVPQSQVADSLGTTQQELPVDIVNEISALVSAVNQLASSAGIQPDTQLGADVDAGIPAENGTGADLFGNEQIAGQDGSAMLEAKKAQIRKKVRESLEAKRAGGSKEDKLIKEAKARARARRRDLRNLRKKVFTEDLYTGNEGDKYSKNIGDVVQSTLMPFVSKPEVDNAVNKAGRNVGPMSKSKKARGSYKLKAGDTWPNVKATVKYAKKSAGTLNEEQEAWDEQHIDHYIERKELNFQEMIKKGMLG